METEDYYGNAKPCDTKIVRSFRVASDGGFGTYRNAIRKARVEVMRDLCEMTKLDNRITISGYDEPLPTHPLDEDGEVMYDSLDGSVEIGITYGN